MKTDNTIHKKVKIEVRRSVEQEWFKVATLENIAFENVEEIIKTIQELNPSPQDREFRIVKC